MNAYCIQSMRARAGRRAHPRARARPVTAERDAVAQGATRPPRRSAAADGAGRPLFAEPIRRETLEELAYRHLRQALVDGRLAPGERIVAGTVAQAAGISRIPVLQ